MPYSHLKLDTIQRQGPKRLFEHADIYLFDAYGMLQTLPPTNKDGGSGDFSATLVLLCMIDGLARWKLPDCKQDEKRFKKLIHCLLPWGPEGKGKWVDKGNAADQFYTEFRNPLVHQLAHDTKANSRPDKYVEPVIGRWGAIPNEFHDIEKIDALDRWDNDWPILMVSTDQQGKPRYKLTVAALYWAVKRMVIEMVAVAGLETPSAATKGGPG